MHPPTPQPAAVQWSATELKHITLYFDFASPYAYLAFELLPEALLGLSYSASYQPVLLAARDPQESAAMAPAHDWQRHHALWLAHSRGIALQWPADLPFNSLPLLQLALACSPEAEPAAPNRYVCESIFRHVWQGAANAVDAARLQALSQALAPPRAVNDAAVAAQLRRNSADAMALGVADTPTFMVDGRLFCGLDALPMLRAYLQQDAWFDGPDWQAKQRPELLRNGA
ncbi:hypothetical protein AwPolaro_09490 [Polaromonas sp.]|nr:hypothetical protein AwPolaro_09490 [Polaromonas sp.]